MESNGSRHLPQLLLNSAMQQAHEILAILAGVRGTRAQEGFHGDARLGQAVELRC